MPYKNPNYCLSKKYFAQEDQKALAVNNSMTKGLFNLLSVAEGELLKDGVDTKDLASLASLVKTIKGSSDSEYTEETIYTEDWTEVTVDDSTWSGQTGKTNLSAISKAINDFASLTNKMVPKNENDFIEMIYNSTDSVSSGTTYFSFPNNLKPLQGE